MGGTRDSKVWLGLGAGGLAAAGLGYAYFKYQEERAKFELLEADFGLPEPLRELPDEEKQYLKAMFREYAEKSKEQGAHLGEKFFQNLQELVYLRTGKERQKLTAAAQKELVDLFKAFNFAEYNKKLSLLANSIRSLESECKHEIFTYFPEPNFVAASYIYGIRYNADANLKTWIEGPKLKNKQHLKVINSFSLSQVLGTIRSKINSRLQQGFEFVDKDNFPFEFQQQLAIEVLAKHDASFDEVWAFCHEELLGDDTVLWEDTMHDYLKMLRTFYHQIPLFSPGIKVM